VNKTYLLFKHEFIQAIKKVGFMVLTFIIPVLALLVIGVIALFNTLTGPSEKDITIVGYVDHTGIFTEHTDLGIVKLIAFTSEEEALKGLINQEISEYFIVASDFTNSGNIQRYALTDEFGSSLVTGQMIKDFLTWNLLKEDVPPEIIGLILTPMNPEVTKLEESGEIAEVQGDIGNIIVPSLFSFLLSMAFMFGANSLISGLGEEKESRLIEVLYSSISVRQLLIGKIMALGAAGLLQVVVWLFSAPLILNLATSVLGGFLINIQIPPNFIILGIVYFVLGYLLFAILSVTIGGISPSANDGHNLSMFYIMASYIPLWTIGLMINSPEKPIWVLLSLFPVTAPTQMMLRLAVSDIPLWQTLTSLGILIFTVIAGQYLSIKIFRVYMLMYGKRPGAAEIMRSLRNV